MIIEKIKKIANIYTGHAKRFTSTIIILLALFITGSVMILADTSSAAYSVLERIAFSLGIGFVFSVFLILLNERFDKPVISKCIVQLIPIIPMIICYIIKVYSSDIYYFSMGYTGICVAALLFSLYFIIRRNNEDVIIPHMIKTVFFAALISLIVLLGLYICIWAVQSLILQEESYKPYLVTGLFVLTMIFPSIVLSGIPQKDDSVSLPKAFKLVAVNSTLPIYLILLLILYIYLVMIIVTKNMPSGRINWFASFASLFFVLLTFCSMPYNGRLTSLFTRYIGLFIVPVTAMQLVAIYQRVSAYGITVPRTVSLIMVALSITFIVYSIIGKAHRHIFVYAAIFALVFTLIPKINVIDLPNINQIVILKNALLKNNMLNDGVISKNPNPDKESAKKIISSFIYLKNSEGTKEDWISSYLSSDLYDVFGFEQSDVVHDYNRYYYYSGKQHTLDISEYNYFRTIDTYGDNDNMEILIYTPQKSYNISVNDLFDVIKSEYDDAEEISLPVMLNENIMLSIIHMSVTCDNNDNIKDYSIFANVFVK